MVVIVSPSLQSHSSKSPDDDKLQNARFPQIRFGFRIEAWYLALPNMRSEASSSAPSTRRLPPCRGESRVYRA